MAQSTKEVLDEWGKLEDAKQQAFFDSDSYYDAADKFYDSLNEYGREYRFEPNGYKEVEVQQIPFISDASIAVAYFIRQSLCLICNEKVSTDACKFPVVLGFQCFELDDADKRRQMFDLQFSGHKKVDNDSFIRYISMELQSIEGRASIFKRFASDEYAKTFCDLVEEAVKATPDYGKGLLDLTEVDRDKSFAAQLMALEANVFGIRLLPTPRRNDWAFSCADDVLRNQVLDFLDFASSLCKQPPNEAAKFVCMLSALLFRLLAKSPEAVERAMKNFSNVFVLVTKTACTIKSYSLPLKTIKSLLDTRELISNRLVALVAGLEILSQSDNSHDMNLLKRSRKYCYLDDLKYHGMKALRLAFQAASVLKISVDELFDLLLEMITIERAKGRIRSIRHSVHLLKLLLRDFSNFDACDSWMYGRVFDDKNFLHLTNKYHDRFIFFCCYVIDPRKRLGVGVWAMKHGNPVYGEEGIREVALAVRRKCNLD
ncbi:hypothetical protein TTRE_0000452701 [Trichuris trichiura]|uniref:Uncharacterized protein n=1 Tax=Trichuris trichiura TaxID=36087 RepID=A0A077Z733_TRITR|nr:hypothetical protein TTRE_0000452701 [Trichuris trichiura]